MAPFFTSARTQNHDQISEEVRLASPTGSRVDYVVGAYYLHQHYGLQNAEGGALFGVYPPIPLTTQYASQNDDSVAGLKSAHLSADFANFPHPFMPGGERIPREARGKIGHGALE